MLDIREESEKLLVPMLCGPAPSRPYLTEREFAMELRGTLGIGLFEAKREARRQFVLIELGRAETVEDLKSVIRRVVNDE